MVYSLNSDDYIGDCSSFKNSEFTQTYPLTRQIRDILLDPDLWQFERSLSQAFELAVNSQWTDLHLYPTPPSIPIG